MTGGESMPAAGNLAWRCRRGMRELDTLLASYLDRCYPSAAGPERRAFAALLELPDPEIWDFLLGNDTPADPELRHVVERIANPATRA